MTEFKTESLEATRRILAQDAAESLDWYRVLRNWNPSSRVQFVGAVEAGRQQEIAKFLTLLSYREEFDRRFTNDHLKLLSRNIVSSDELYRLTQGRDRSTHAADIIESAVRLFGVQDAIGYLSSRNGCRISTGSWQVVGGDDKRRLSIFESPLQLGLTPAESEWIFGGNFEETSKVLKTKTKLIREYSGQSKGRDQSIFQLRLTFEQGRLVGWDDERDRVRDSDRVPEHGRGGIYKNGLLVIPTFQDDFGVFVLVSLAKATAGRDPRELLRGICYPDPEIPSVGVNGWLWTGLRSKYQLPDFPNDSVWRIACLDQMDDLGKVLFSENDYVDLAMDILHGWHALDESRKLAIMESKRKIETERLIAEEASKRKIDAERMIAEEAARGLATRRFLDKQRAEREEEEANRLADEEDAKVRKEVERVTAEEAARRAAEEKLLEELVAAGNERERVEGLREDETVTARNALHFYASSVLAVIAIWAWVSAGRSCPSLLRQLDASTELARSVTSSPLRTLSDAGTRALNANPPIQYTAPVTQRPVPQARRGNTSHHNHHRRH